MALAQVTGILRTWLIDKGLNCYNWLLEIQVI